MNNYDKKFQQSKKINLIIFTIFTLLILITLVTADWTRTYCLGSSVCDSGNVAGDSALCNLANKCEEEGDIYCSAESSFPNGDLTEGPITTENINWDSDQNDCACHVGQGMWALGGEIAQTSCCGDDAGENYIGPDNGKSCDGTSACCVSASDYVKNGLCVSACYLWENLFENEITGANKGDSIRLVLRNTGLSEGSEVQFEIYEGSDSIRVGANAITGTVDGGVVIAHWTITPEDLDKTSSLSNFQFTTDFSGDVSDDLRIFTNYNNTPTTIGIVSPSCGEYLNAGPETVEIIINVDDDDDFIEGILSINDLQIATFENGETTIGYTFSEGGNYKILAETIDNQSKKARVISNIMVIDTTIDGEYVAACITKPKDYSDIPTSYVEFDASDSLGIRYNAATGITAEINPSGLNFSWSFSDGRTNPYHLGTNELSYHFFKNFYTVGNNWAKLKVSII